MIRICHSKVTITFFIFIKLINRNEVIQSFSQSEKKKVSSVFAMQELFVKSRIVC